MHKPGGWSNCLQYLSVFSECEVKKEDFLLHAQRQQNWLFFPTTVTLDRKDSLRLPGRKSADAALEPSGTSLGGSAVPPVGICMMQRYVCHLTHECVIYRAVKERKKEKKMLFVANA